MPMPRHSVQHSRPTPTGHYIGQSDRLRLWTGQKSRLQERYTGNGHDPMPFPCVLLLESGPVYTTCRLGFDIGLSVIAEPVYYYTRIVHHFNISASMHAHLPSLDLVRILEGAE